MAEQHSTETWRPVVGYEGCYEVSDHGGVKRVKRGPATWPGRILRPARDRKGYLYVALCQGDNSTKRRFPVHRLVLAAFVGPCPPGLQVNHKNGVQADNRIGNLEYVTARENMRHARVVLGRVMGGGGRGESIGNSKLNESAVRDIRRRYRPRVVTYKQLATDYGVAESTVHRVVNRDQAGGWAHVV